MSKSIKFDCWVRKEESKIIWVRDGYVCLDMYIGTLYNILIRSSSLRIIRLRGEAKQETKHLFRIVYRFGFYVYDRRYSNSYHMRSSKIVYPYGTLWLWLLRLWLRLLFRILYSLDLYTYILWLSLMSRM